MPSGQLLAVTTYSDCQLNGPNPYSFAYFLFYTCLIYSKAQFKLYTLMSVSVCVCIFTACKTLKMACMCTVAHNFGVHTIASEHTQHTSDACLELRLGLPHYTCSVQVQ